MLNGNGYGVVAGADTLFTLGDIDILSKRTQYKD